LLRHLHQLLVSELKLGLEIADLRLLQLHLFQGLGHLKHLLPQELVFICEILLFTLVSLLGRKLLLVVFLTDFGSKLVLGQLDRRCIFLRFGV
jgi:hypothetical protein